MTIFELVKLALDELYEEGIQEYAGKLDATIKTRMTYLTGSYETLLSGNRKPIDYRDPATRFAYAFKYVAAHGDYLVQALEATRHEIGKYIFEEDTLRLSCIGGGPGSDVIGVLKYLAEHSDEPTRKLTCYLLDGEQAWADTWTEIGASLASNLAVNVNFQKLDVTDPKSWSAQKKFLKADLFTLSYFVSEVQSLDTGVIAAFWKTIFDGAKSGAIFVYVDNGHDVFNEYFDAQWNNRGDIKCILTNNNLWKTPRYTEQASEIGEYRIKFGHSPKLKSLLSFRVLRKS